VFQIKAYSLKECHEVDKKRKKGSRPISLEMKSSSVWRLRREYREFYYE